MLHVEQLYIYAFVVTCSVRNVINYLRTHQYSSHDLSVNI